MDINKVPEQRASRIGEIRKNKFGTSMEIIEYNCYRDITIVFKDSHQAIVKTRYDAFLDGRVRNPYDRYVCGVGYLGYDVREKLNYGILKSHKMWEDMIKRCYNPASAKKYPTYKEVRVCDEWHNYLSFKKWYDENYWEVENDFMCLDKDIMIKGNKIYSPETCVIVPNRINVLFTKSNKTRGDYPIGVFFNKSKNKYESTCSTFVKEVGRAKGNRLGAFNSVEEAYNTYKEFKEKYIKQVADEYSNKYKNFPNKLYRAMYNYEVEITD